MAVTELDTVPRVSRPPRAMAWVVLAASAGAVLSVGIAATLILFTSADTYPSPIHPRFWLLLGAASVVTIVSLSLRSLRWIFLLRRAETRIPIRDAYIGYFAGFALLFTPLLAGEIALRAWVHRARGNVPVRTTMVVNIWERLVDLCALSLIAVAAGLLVGSVSTWTYTLAAGSALSLITPLRRLALRIVSSVSRPVSRAFDDGVPVAFDHLADLDTWLAALGTSVVAWLLPSVGFWLLAHTPERTLGLIEAVHTYSASATASVLTLAPGGVLIAGRQMLATLIAHGYPDASAVLTVFGVRLATVGVSVAVGVIFAFIHMRSTAADSTTHFDDIADAYDVQIPESRRHALLVRKTDLMKSVIGERGIGRRGLDVGCGQGSYVARMREIGFDVDGIDMSAGQVRLAARNVGAEGIVQVGSVLDIPAPDETFDFLYIINVLHHLSSVEEQRRAFAELLRVLKPGGLLFVHEINTRNIVFRFYMGYVFPSLNCIDEGIERWLLAHRLDTYTSAPVVDVRYFTFLPDFVPAPIVRLLSPIERFLERSALRVYSAHYMAVLRK